jgi:hypothetical protein
VGASSALWAACAAQQQDGVSATAHTPVTGGLDASTSAPGWLDASTPLAPPIYDSSTPIYTVVDGASTGFGDGGCGATAVEAKQVVIKDEKIVEEQIDEVQPVAIYVVLDQSISMGEQGLWAPAKEALKGFVNDPASAGIDVALELFPDDAFFYDPTGLSESLGLLPICDGSQNDVPMVAMGRLPAHAANLTRGLDSRPNPIGIGTPIATALRGAGTFCSRFEQGSMGEECVAVLVTDGEPSGCEAQTQQLVQLVQTIYAGGMGTRLFTVGLQGANFGLLDALAQAGGAVDCDANSDRFSCDVSGGPEQLRDAMQKIRNVVTTVKTRVETTTRIEDVPVECEWTIPPPPPGEKFDRERVNVRATAPGLVTPLDFGQVANAASCTEKGWHYDNSNAPTRLIACPQTCSLLRATPLAKVSVLLGCATVTLH